MSYAALGCPACYYSAGGAQCNPCSAATSDMPECQDCEGVRRISKGGLLTHPLAGPVIVGIVGTIATGIMLYGIRRTGLVPKGMLGGSGK